MRITESLRHLFCRHRRVEFVRNIYGDEINRHSTIFVYRSWWRCLKCGAIILSREFVDESRRPVIRDRKEKKS